jgi:hypothetical protein
VGFWRILDRWTVWGLGWVGVRGMRDEADDMNRAKVLLRIRGLPMRARTSWRRESLHTLRRIGRGLFLGIMRNDGSRAYEGKYTKT